MDASMSERPRRIKSLPARLKRGEVDLPAFAHGTWNSPDPVRRKKMRKHENGMSIWELNEALRAISPVPPAAVPPAPASVDDKHGADALALEDLGLVAGPSEEEDTMALLQALVAEESAAADAVGSPDELLAAMGMAVGDTADGIAGSFELLAPPDPSPSPAASEAHHLAPTPVAPPPLAPVPAAAAPAASLGGGGAGRNVAERKEWTSAEDELIAASVATHGCKWRIIAAQLPGRSDDAVRNRWNRLKEVARARGAAEGGEGSEASQPKPPRPAARGGGERPERVSWSREEDGIIVSSVAELGHRWGKIATRLPGRTEHAIRNRFSRLQSLVSQGTPVVSPSLVAAGKSGHVVAATPVAASPVATSPVAASPVACPVAAAPPQPLSPAAPLSGGVGRVSMGLQPLEYEAGYEAGYEVHEAVLESSLLDFASAPLQAC